MSLPFDNSYARLPSRFYARVDPTPVAKPVLLALNAPLARTIGFDLTQWSTEQLALLGSGNQVPQGAEPIALAYAGHQFGGFVPKLGDGRAILLGEVVGADGQRRDVQLKGAGRTPYSRGGDGRAAMGPVLREYVVSEAMAALGVPTTRALLAVATGEPVYREEALPGAVLTRVASSHLRVGTFQYFAARQDVEAVTLLTDYALTRHYPHAARGERPALALLDAAISAQAKLVAHWLSLGFVHGVMNTDNTSIAGETIDYGPCAFLDSYHPMRKFSSIDRGGRYAFSQQPLIALWNLSRLAEALLLIVDDDERAVSMLEERLKLFYPQFEAEHARRSRRKLGLTTERDDDPALFDALLKLMAEHKIDFTLWFRRLCDVAESPARRAWLTDLCAAPQALDGWLDAWQSRCETEPTAPAERAARMRTVNPAFIPRNHRVEEMIAAAVEGDMKPFERMNAILSRPFEDQPASSAWMAPPGDEQWQYRTFCGT